MPLWLRRFTFNKMKEWFESQQQGKGDYLVNEDNPATQITIPEAVRKLSQEPTYNVKAPKKK